MLFRQAMERCLAALSSRDGDGRKFYYNGPVTEGWSGLLGEESGNFLLVSVCPDKIPLLGVWKDEGCVMIELPVHWSLVLVITIHLKWPSITGRRNGLPPIPPMNGILNSSLVLVIGSKQENKKKQTTVNTQVSAFSFQCAQLTVVKNNTVMLWCNQIQRKIPDMEWEYRRNS